MLVRISSMVTADSLPAEILLQIFSGLRYRDLVSAGRTCSRWYEVSRDDCLLRQIARRDIDLNTWTCDKFNPTEEDICLAMRLGIVIEMYQIAFNHDMKYTGGFNPNT